MLIVPDTNALFGDPLMLSDHSQKILALSQDAESAFVMSPVVVGEIRRQYLENHAVAAKTMSAQLRRFARTSGVDADQAAEAVQALGPAAEAAWKSRVDGLVGAGAWRLAEWPDCRADELVARELERRRPFIVTDKGSIGLRDTLIWLGVVQLLEETSEEPIVFVTKDNGFLDKSGLHSDLAQDLVDAGIDDDRLHIVTSLGALTPVLTQEISRVEDERSDRLGWRTAAIIGRIHDMLADLPLADYAPVWDEREGGLADPAFDLNVPTDVDEWTEVTSTDDTDELDFPEELHLGPGDLELEFQTSLQLEGFMHKSDWYLSETEDLVLADSDWNDQYVVVQVERKVTFRIKIMLGDEDDDVEIEDVLAVTFNNDFVPA